MKPILRRDNRGTNGRVPAGEAPARKKDEPMLRDMVKIDEELCDGCGECVPSCAEGAIQIIDGKARLVSDVLCDGLGACLGHCPQGAITVEQREAAAFNEQAVEQHLAGLKAVERKPDLMSLGQEAKAKEPCGCPGSAVRQFQAPGPRAATMGDDEVPPLSNDLRQWPVQLKLVPPQAPFLQGAHLLVAADCVPFAYPDFHRQMLRGKAVVVACPKLDDPEGYVEKLTEMFRSCNLAGVTVALMEVPCCAGILMMVQEARRRSGSDVPVDHVVVGVQGEILTQGEVPAAAAV
jgi:ferredoxin